METSTRLNIITIGKHLWKFPPNQDHLNFPVSQGLARRLGGLHRMIVVGKADKEITRTTEDVSVTYIPYRYPLWKFIVRSKKDAETFINSHSGPTLILSSDVWGAISSWWTSTQTQTPYLVQLQGNLLSPGPEYGNRLRRALIRGASKFVTKRADGVRALNSGILREVDQLGGKGRAVVLGSRVDTDLFVPTHPRPGSLPDVRIISVGALVDRKNHHTVIRAMPALLQAHPEARLSILGEGPEEESLRSLTISLGIEKHVHFLGYRTYNEIPTLLSEADIFCLMSFSEGQPRAVLEAQACGLPVVGSSIPAIMDIVAHESTGLLAAPTDSEGIARHFTRLASDEDLRRRLSISGRAHVMSHHSFDAALDLLANFIRDVHLDSATRRKSAATHQT